MNFLSDHSSSCFSTRAVGITLLSAGMITLLAAPARAERPDFQEIVQPLLTRYCYECHGNNDATRKADLNLEYYQTVESLSTMPDMLEDALFYVEEGDMPPKKYAHQPTEKELEALIAFFDGTLGEIEGAAKNDPGHVVAPRLNHLEYDRVVSDLTGVRIRAAHFFPRDSGSGEGFTNVGADQQANTVYLEKWLEAARFVASHARVTAKRGIRWFPEPQAEAANEPALLASLSADWALWHAEQEDLQSQNDEEIHASYLLATWQYENRAQLGAPDATPEQVTAAFDPPLYPSILETYHEFLTRDPQRHIESNDERIAELTTLWQALPGPEEPGVDLIQIKTQTEALAEEYFGNHQKRREVRELTRGARSDFSGNFYTPYTDYKGFDISILATPEMQSPPNNPPKDPGPFFLDAEDMRRNASAQDLAKLNLLIAEVDAARHPDLAAEEEIARTVLEELAPRAWRREVQPEEIEALLEPYREGRKNGETLDAAVKDSLTALLVSPEFLFRLRREEPEGEVVPLAPTELASRLSFALWGTLPDETLLQKALSGELAQETVYQEEIGRMIQDRKSRFLAEQFAAQWLHFSNFAESAQPDSERFPEFNAGIARDMEESLKRFFHDVFQENRPITALVTARQMPMSERLAAYYGLAEPPKRGDGEWAIRDLPENFSGILSSGPITIGHSQPLRTSPIKRGAWIVIELLGTPMPDPPPDIPEISEDEISPDGLTVAHQMAIHREDPACYSCHQKLDPMGLALENIDAAGRWRVEDIGGNALITTAETPDGTKIQGLEGLAQYLSRPENARAMARQFSHKLVGYLLGREVQIGDRELIDSMVDAMEEQQWQVMPALRLALLSPQFLQKRNTPQT